MPSVSTIYARTPDEVHSLVNAHLVEGYQLRNQTGSEVVLFKPKQFSIVWAVIGFFFMLLPLVIYIIVYAMQSDKVVQIILKQPPAPWDVQP